LAASEVAIIVLSGVSCDPPEEFAREEASGQFTSPLIADKGEIGVVARAALA
jgi:hypothetical protein